MKITKSLDVRQEDGWIVASTPAVDRDHDRIMSMGIDTSDYAKNPILLFGHNYDEPWAMIGRAAEIMADMTGLRIRPELREPANEVDPMHIVRALWQQNLLRTASIGFIPLESRENEFGGRDFLKTSLLEISLVPVPANQEAIRMAVKAFSAKTNEPHTEPDINHAEPATIHEPNELTPEQEAQLAQALTAFVDEMTELLTGD